MAGLQLSGINIELEAPRPSDRIGIPAASITVKGGLTPACPFPSTNSRATAARVSNFEFYFLVLSFLFFFFF